MIEMNYIIHLQHMQVKLNRTFFEMIEEMMRSL
jgi:hypothetical protein